MDSQQHVALFLALTAASGIIWVWVGRQLRSGQQPLEYEPRATERRSLPAVVFTLLLIGYSTFSSFTSSSGEVTLELVKHNCVISLGITVFLGILLLLPRQSRFSDFGIRLSKLPEQIVIGATGFLASLMPVFAVLVLTAPLRSVETQHPYLTFVHDNPGSSTVAWVIFAVAIMAPIAEELQYRVIFQGWLQSLLPARYAIPIAAFVFSSVHGFPDSLALVPLALVLGYVYYRSNSYLAAVIVHSLFNAMNVFILLAGSAQAREAASAIFRH